jgi:hypothetical protein
LEDLIQLKITTGTSLNILGISNQYEW